MMGIKSDRLLMLPYEKELCVKVLNPSRMDINESIPLSIDTTHLYLSEVYINKRWKMFINKTVQRIYILTGTVRLRHIRCCGNIVLYYSDGSNMIRGGAYVNIPLYYTADPGFTVKNVDPNDYSYIFTPRKFINGIYNKYCYITGVLKVTGR